MEVGGGGGRVDDVAGEREEVGESEREGGFERWEKVFHEMSGGDGWDGVEEKTLNGAHVEPHEVGEAERDGGLRDGANRRRD